jgi:hypothetical protein
LVDISRAFGSDTTSTGIKRALDRYFKPNAKRINDSLSTGKDPKDLNIGIDGSATSGQIFVSRSWLCDVDCF